MKFEMHWHACAVCRCCSRSKKCWKCEKRAPWSWVFNTGDFLREKIMTSYRITWVIQPFKLNIQRQTDTDTEDSYQRLICLWSQLPHFHLPLELVCFLHSLQWYPMSPNRPSLLTFGRDFGVDLARSAFSASMRATFWFNLSISAWNPLSLLRSPRFGHLS